MIINQHTAESEIALGGVFHIAQHVVLSERQGGFSL